MDKQEITARLENWVYDKFLNVIWGDIYEDVHGRFVDGTWIHTSDIPKGRINYVNFKEGDVIRTLNSSYLLGTPRGAE